MLDRARKLDPQQLALAVFESDCQADDLSKQLFDSRSRAYNFIFKTLKDAKSLLLPNASLENRAPVADKTLYVKQVFEEALQNKDPLFHYQLYYWYIQENMMDELLLVDTEYLIPFFTRVIKDERTSLEFLWQYYRSKSQFYKSACCLASLAELSSNEITLESRMKYLAYARINCRCGEQEPDTPSHATSQLSQKLDNLMNACRFQARIQNVLKNTGDLDANVVAKELDHQLIDEKRKLYPLTERFPVLLELFES
jgi:nuclear pore complex protein Nup155